MEKPVFLVEPDRLGPLKARYSTTSFRNDEQLAELGQVFAHDLKSGEGFFKTVVFEFDNAGHVAMSWRLTTQEVLDLENGLDSAENKERMSKLVDVVGRSGRRAGTVDVRGIIGVR